MPCAMGFNECQNSGTWQRERLPSVDPETLGESGFFAECQNRGTRRSGVLCRVLDSGTRRNRRHRNFRRSWILILPCEIWLSVNSLPSARKKALGKVVFAVTLFAEGACRVHNGFCRCFWHSAKFSDPVVRPDAGARPGVALGSKLRHAERKLVSAGWTDASA